jgi:D-alanyl-D-alanine carboxypeptidase/D-alanyl-D-alanine-endopeptidase (penicillin-binding protein 4)
MMKLIASPLLVFALFLPAEAQAFKTWIQRLEGRGVKVSAGIWELDSGKLIEGHKTDVALIPASTTKVIATYALLRSWKPNYVFETELWGALSGDTVTGDLVFKGAGDPVLTSERLWLMAQELKRRGILRVQGSIRLDQSAFDGQRYGNGWENTSSDDTPPIFPLAVNWGRDESGKILHNPEPLAIETITRIFREGGIQILDQAPREGEMVKLLAFPSRPLRDYVQDINKYSNNFMIEMLVKRFGDGSWTKGMQRIQAFYQENLNLGPDRIAITDGSGLSKDNRLSAKTLVTVLRAGWHDFEVGPEFVASLKVQGGEPWTLSWKDADLVRRVRYKTGHVNDVTSMCGYLQAPNGKLRVFAVILNGKSRNEDVYSMVSTWAH